MLLITYAVSGWFGQDCGMECIVRCRANEISDHGSTDIGNMNVLETYGTGFQKDHREKIEMVWACDEER